MTSDTATHIGFWLLAWAVLSLAVAGAWVAYRARAKRLAAEAVPAAGKAATGKRGPLVQHFCPYCHRAGVYMTKTGQPNRRYHQCDPAAVQAHVWPPAFAVTDEPQPPQTVTTWPPEVTP
jgi:hypothetical protein